MTYLIPCENIKNGKKCMNPIDIDDPKTGHYDVKQTEDGFIYYNVICSDCLRGIK
ncbi:MAG: hypothetical protein A4E27_00524 [Methanobacterium sp. PtaU1.Bin242]|nr:MAG: hypothetical protein A4E27_00524 [Methanobacterium sp. PtaU1.Bin242]